MTTFEERIKDHLSHVYDIQRELGGGGMSKVFIATDRSLGRKIVIKLLSPELTAGVNRERFRREIQVAAQLQHPHIVPLLSAGEDGDIVYYTMPFIEGESLKTALEKGPLPVRDVVRILYDVVDALGYAHAHGVVHRDIKPANILRSGAHSLVTDFGVAKALNASMPSQQMTSTGLAIGTPAYMAPEQLAGDPTADHRVDIYAIGLTAYELLSGQSPFAALSPQAVMAALFTVDPKPLDQVRKDVPKRLSAIIMQCLSKDAAQRPANADVLLNALDTVATSSGEIRTREHRVPTTVTGKTPTVTAPANIIATFPVGEEKGGKGKWIAAAVVLLLLLGAGGFMFMRGGSSAGKAAPAAMTKIDSMQIAQAIAKQIADAQAAAKAAAATAKPGTQVAAVNVDSIRKALQKKMTDSIQKAKAATVATAPAFAGPNANTATGNLAPAPAAAPAAAPAPAPAPAPATIGAPAAAGEKTKLAITEFKGDQMNSFNKQFIDALRGSVGDDKFSLVGQDAVKGMSGDDAAKAVSPEVLIVPSVTGEGDTVTVAVSIRDLRRMSSYGIHTVRMKTMPAYPQYYVQPLVQAVIKQLEAVSQATYRH